MDIDDLTDDELDRLASKLAGHLPTGRHGEKIVTTRRQLLAAAAGGSIGVTALVKLGIDPATAQSAAGQVGTSSSPEDVYAYNLDVSGALQSTLDAGGQAIENAGSVSTESLASDMQDPTDELSNRSLDTEYQNDTDVNRIVNIVVQTDGSQKVDLLFRRGSSSGSLAQMDRFEIPVGDLTSTTILPMGPYKIPPGQYYTLGSLSSHDAQIYGWYEWHETSQS